jgi:hypothetical protein
VRPRLGADATLGEWLAEPEGSARLRGAVGTDEHGRQRGIFGDGVLCAMIGNGPLGRLVAFPGVGIDHAAVARVTRSATP